MLGLDFQVTDPLPNVTLAMDLGRNWAGNIGVNRTHHSNDTLFFWGFEHSPGSLTDVNNDKREHEVILVG